VGKVLVNPLHESLLVLANLASLFFLLLAAIAGEGCPCGVRVVAVAVSRGRALLAKDELGI